MKQYTVTGMSCAACQAHVEKAVAAVPGVDKVAVSLLTNSMSVEGSADDAQPIVLNAGENPQPCVGIVARKQHHFRWLTVRKDFVQLQKTPHKRKGDAWFQHVVFMCVLVIAIRPHTLFTKHRICLVQLKQRR